jgi:enoyl-CoA hydratase/carnithine racemase
MLRRMSVRFEPEGQTALITIDRPEKLNAMNSAIYAELGRLFTVLDESEELLVGIVTGAGGRAFSAGADLKEMHGPETKRRGWGPWRPDGWSFGRTTRKPLIAAIDGFALAGGLELALTCDIRIATPNSTFGAPEVRWALLHGLGATRLPAAVGLSNAMSLLLTGESIDSEEALRIGLISKIVPQESLLEEARGIAAKIASNNPIAVQMSKELALRAAMPAAEESLRLYRSYFAYLENLPEQSAATASFSSRERSG